MMLGIVPGPEQFIYTCRGTDLRCRWAPLHRGGGAVLSAGTCHRISIPSGTGAAGGAGAEGITRTCRVPSEGRPGTALHRVLPAALPKAPRGAPATLCAVMPRQPHGAGTPRGPRFGPAA